MTVNPTGGGPAPDRRRRALWVALTCGLLTLAAPPMSRALGGDGAEGSTALLLVPPERGDDRLRLEALATAPDIDRVVFFVDGREAGADRRRPFRLEVRSADDTIRSVRAEAYDRDGILLGQSELDLSPTGPPFRVAITGAEVLPTGSVDVEVGVSVPPDAELDRVDLFLNGAPAARLEEPPFRATLPAKGAGPDDYLQVVARLRDGRSLEDARPLHAASTSDRLDVCLVDVYAVVSDRWGEPVRGLGPDSFRVRSGARPLTVERFQEASEVPLGVGLVIDSSESMRRIMAVAKEAAHTFLERALIPGDEAFLVDIGTVPRLVREMTPSASELSTAFADLEPGGTTALYDAILLGLLRLEGYPGRRALVVLTDGRDFGSDFGPGRGRVHAERAGVPIYVLSMAGLAQQRTNPERNFRLESLARSTGGRLLHVATPEDFDRAYAEIDEELRSQYVLGIASERVLSAEELSALSVEVDHPGARVRAARSRADF